MWFFCSFFYTICQCKLHASLRSAGVLREDVTKFPFCMPSKSCLHIFQLYGQVCQYIQKFTKPYCSYWLPYYRYGCQVVFTLCRMFIFFHPPHFRSKFSHAFPVIFVGLDRRTLRQWAGQRHWYYWGNVPTVVV